MDQTYKQRSHRSTFMKHTIMKWQPEMPTSTAWDIMKAHGYDRIWDCGTIKFEWTRQ